MNKRIIWGLLGAIIGLGVILLGGIWFTLTIGALATLGILEYSQLLKRQNLRPQTEVLIFTTLLLLAIVYLITNYRIRPGDPLLICERILTLMLFAVFIITLIHELLRGAPEQGLLNAAVNLFGAVYIGFMFAYILMIRFIPGRDGLFFILFTVLVTWANDTAAYFVGVNFGKHKLSPRISPHKSVEGSIGGLSGGLIGSLVLALVFTRPWLPLIIFGVFVAIAGQIGDLIESIIKRNAGVKDSGTFLPGHGGLLDRLDSLLLAAPVVYYTVIYLTPHL